LLPAPNLTEPYLVCKKIKMKITTPVPQIAKRAAVVVFSSLDTSGGAGITQDAYFIKQGGAHPFCLQTGVAVQNNERVFKIVPTAPKCFEQMIKSVPASIESCVVKIGLICNKNQPRLIKNFAESNKCAGRIILDAPIISTSGFKITTKALSDAIVENLLVNCLLFTPNNEEVKYFGGVENIFKMGVENILLKAQQNDKKNNDEIYDILLNKNGERFVVKNPRLALKKQIRGTGCALISLVAGHLASALLTHKSMPLQQNLQNSVKFASNTLAKMLQTPYCVYGDCNFLP